MKSLWGVTLLALLHAAASTPRVAGVARCANVWDEGCVSGQLQGAGRDDDFVNGDFSPGKRCAGAWGEGCAGGPRHAAARDSWSGLSLPVRLRDLLEKLARP